LRQNNASLTHKVRVLEQRVEKHDEEHAALATDLVKVQIENGDLKDENESLKGQVVELRSVIETQPQEVEERLKTEMDRLMKRNQEVHEENTKLEEEMSEMEQTLVATKMQYAEVCFQLREAISHSNVFRSTLNTKLSLENGMISERLSTKLL
jgi:predicted  nucleic acid-binding Zn-ribbon protein